MTWLDFKEAADMARKLVTACTHVRKYPCARDFVLAAFEEEIKFRSSGNQGADTEMDNFGDGFSILQHAVRIAEVWMQFWSDVHHNGRPMRWLKITRDLALQGKTESILYTAT